MATTPRTKIPYPDAGAEPWYDKFKAAIEAIDFSLFASREDRNILISGGGTLTFTAGSDALTWSADIALFSPTTGYQWRITGPNSATLTDGTVCYVTLSRAAQGNVTLTLKTGLFVPNDPDGDSNFIIGLRIGSKIHFREGFVLADGDSKILFDTATGAGIEFQEEGIALSTRAKLNFIGSNITAVDNPGQSRVDVTLLGPAAPLTVAATGAIDDQTSVTSGTPDYALRFTGAAPVLNGIASGTDGRRIYLYFVNATTVSNEAVSSTAANRIYTGSGTDVFFGAGSAAQLVYDSAVSRWHLLNTANYVDLPTVVVSTSPYNAADISSHFSVDTSTLAITINLPTSPSTRRRVEVADRAGNAAVNNITIDGNGKTITGLASIVLSSNYAGLVLVYNGLNWSVL